ncbi:murein L,D-transpeptidase [Flavobacterium sp. 83]|jgi:murein L,D-transpeptidase YcbB/YkuD|uniref:L,D-transpeptidase family protein n=1 Tax=Flavobacterium sp. 83 TaxID=1131812 RepID=UPI0005514BE8|nr:L,D-transpeptidase family protein [Flavobacterium sp. 83]
MRNSVISFVIIFFSISLANANLINNKKGSTKLTATPSSYRESTEENSTILINSTIISEFFKKYPDLKNYKSEVTALYKKRNYKSIWYDHKGVIAFADLLYSKANQLKEDGIKSNLAYKDKIDGIFNKQNTPDLSPTDTELLLSSLYIFYAKKVYQGIDTTKIRAIGWFLVQKNLPYENLLDSLLIDPQLLNKNEKQLFGQYYKLRTALKKYRQIEKNGDWNSITAEILTKEYQPGDSSKTIAQIRHRLAVTGDLKQDSKSNLYDKTLMSGVLNYKKRNSMKADYAITSMLIQRMNTPIEKYIKAIIVNMERCRWIAPEMTKADEYIFINIPSFKLIYKRNGKKELESEVFVGETMNETAIISSHVTQIVFSPYWNVPSSIIETELIPAISREKNYLEDHNMEWNNGKIRQKPGEKNALGLVKFIFPNDSGIYLHDTPSKSLFESEYRAYSHGCINMNKAKELALLLLKDDPDWPIERINNAMNGEKETVCTLKKKIPIHIGYFTTWVNDSGEISFYNDVYERDNRLAELLFLNESK